MRTSSVSQAIVEPYADALMSVAKDQNLVEDFGKDVDLILSVLSSSEDLRKFFAVPVIDDSAKKQMLTTLFGTQIHSTVLNFLMILIAHRRILFLEAICRQFKALLRKMNNVALAEITSAIPLNSSQEDTLRQKVTSLTKANSVELSVKLNPDLIGGVIIKVGSQVIDASIRGQLRRLSSRLTANV